MMVLRYHFLQGWTVVFYHTELEGKNSNRFQKKSYSTKNLKQENKEAIKGPGDSKETETSLISTPEKDK